MIGLVRKGPGAAHGERGLTPRKLQCLRLIHDFPGISRRELGELMGCHPTSNGILGHLFYLKSLGLVSSDKQRARTTVITRDGREVLLRSGFLKYLYVEPLKCGACGTVTFDYDAPCTNRKNHPRR